MSSVITIDVALWGLAIGTLLPILVGIVTAKLTPSGGKSIILLLLAAVIAVGQEILAVGSFEIKAALLKLALLFFASVGTHFGLLKPSGITGADGAVANVAPNGLLNLGR